MAGDGARRMINIISSIASEDYNIVMIDEFDNGLHYSAHKLMWKILLKAIEKPEYTVVCHHTQYRMYTKLKNRFTKRRDTSRSCQCV